MCATADFYLFVQSHEMVAGKVTGHIAGNLRLFNDIPKVPPVLIGQNIHNISPQPIGLAVPRGLLVPIQRPDYEI